MFDRSLAFLNKKIEMKNAHLEDLQKLEREIFRQRAEEDFKEQSRLYTIQNKLQTKMQYAAIKKKAKEFGAFGASKQEVKEFQQKETENLKNKLREEQLQFLEQLKQKRIEEEKLLEESFYWQKVFTSTPALWFSAISHSFTPCSTVASMWSSSKNLQESLQEDNKHLLQKQNNKRENIKAQMEQPLDVEDSVASLKKNQRHEVMELNLRHLKERLVHKVTFPIYHTKRKGRGDEETS